jgi:hypothetical protein
VPLTRQIVVEWLVDQTRSHMDRCGFSTSDDPPDGRFTRVIGDALRRINLDPVDPGTVTDEEIAAVPLGSLTRFYLACLIALKKRVLNHYLSQVTQGVIQTRKEFDKRAKDLMVDIASDEESYAVASTIVFSDGASGACLFPGTNVPDAVCIPYRP